VHSDAKSVKEHIDSLPENRQDTISKVREVILKNLPDGYVETMNWGMISYEVPLTLCPKTYNGKPLMYAALASQKNHMALYISAIYASKESREIFEKAYRATGKRFDAGKSCVRFKKLEDLPLELIGESISLMKPDEYIALVNKLRTSSFTS